MKIAITSTGATLDAPMDPRFGRAAFILIVDTEGQVLEVLDNSENIRAFEGAGIQAATTISDHGAEALLTGYCGPKAFKVLEAAGIRVAADVSGSGREALAAFRVGKLPFIDAANAEAHW
ncbi:MAG: NifB/NifX family molybdenum-iron cluster-binding protein [Desulfobulbaceae bacterium]|nr:NifB/NifX family molybdenum-iron cluster-binding protein [Desulfobulbaceae bacterium]